MHCYSSLLQLVPLLCKAPIADSAACMPCHVPLSSHRLLLEQGGNPACRACSVPALLEPVLCGVNQMRLAVFIGYREHIKLCYCCQSSTSSCSFCCIPCFSCSHVVNLPHSSSIIVTPLPLSGMLLIWSKHSRKAERLCLR
jgi:hypothetical protein